MNEERKKKEKKAKESRGLSWGNPNPKKGENMRYVLGEEPRTSSEAFDALENTFGGDEFSRSDAETVLEEILDVTPSEASSEFRRLLRNEAIEEA